MSWMFHSVIWQTTLVRSLVCCHGQPGHTWGIRVRINPNVCSIVMTDVIEHMWNNRIIYNCVRIYSALRRLVIHLNARWTLDLGRLWKWVPGIQRTANSERHLGQTTSQSVSRMILSITVLLRGSLNFYFSPWCFAFRVCSLRLLGELTLHLTYKKLASNSLFDIHNPMSFINQILHFFNRSTSLMPKWGACPPEPVRCATQETACFTAPAAKSPTTAV